MNGHFLGIGTSSVTGVSAACANNSSHSSSSPPNQQSSNQHLPKNTSATNRNENKDGLTSPMNHTKSPSESQSSKNEADKMRSGKSRNKEGI